MYKPKGYSIQAYGSMTRPGPRLNAYARALARVITPDSVALDIGCGAGLMALLAARMGARTVYAIEPDESIILAKQLAQDNGLAGRIIFIQDVSTRVSLPEKADVMISDLRGTLPLFQRHIPSLVDARARLLKPGGVMLAQRDRIFIAPAELAQAYEEAAAPWENEALGLNLERGREQAVNTLSGVYVEPADLLAPPEQAAELDYAVIESPDATWKVEHIIARAGTLRGLVCWFDATVWDDIGFSNAPGQPKLVYRQTCFPARRPIAVLPGDVIRGMVQAKLVGDEYVWQWRIQHQPAGQAASEWQKLSWFNSQPLALDGLRKGADSFVPRRAAPAEADLFILASMNGQDSVAHIAQTALERFPDQFATLAQARAQVAALSRQYAA